MTAIIIDFATRRALNASPKDPRTLTIRAAYRATFPANRPPYRAWSLLEKAGFRTLEDLTQVHRTVIAFNDDLGPFITSLLGETLWRYGLDFSDDLPVDRVSK